MKGDQPMATAEIGRLLKNPARNTAVSSGPWYATDLSRWDAASEQRPDDRDLVQDGKAYRRLSPEYSAWLCARMLHAQPQHQRGLLPNTASAQLRDRFNAMQDEAIDLFGEATLLAVNESLDLQGYEPPSLQAAIRSQSLLPAAQTQDTGVHPLAIWCVADTTRAGWHSPDRPSARAGGARPWRVCAHCRVVARASLDFRAILWLNDPRRDGTHRRVQERRRR